MHDKSPPRSCHRNGANDGAFGRPLFQLLKQRKKKENIYWQHTYPCLDGFCRFYCDERVEGPKQPKSDSSDPIILFHATFMVYVSLLTNPPYVWILSLRSSSCSPNNIRISLLTHQFSMSQSTNNENVYDLTETSPDNNARSMLRPPQDPMLNISPTSGGIVVLLCAFRNIVCRTVEVVM